MAATATSLPTHEEIEVRVRAYELWQERGCPEGSPEVDWLAAENELFGGVLFEVGIDEILN